MESKVDERAFANLAEALVHLAFPLKTKDDYPVRMENPFDTAIPCFGCGKPISPEADPCPHCGQPEAGVQSALKKTREIAQEYQRQQAEERMRRDQYLYERREKLVFKIIFLGIPLGVMVVGMVMAFIGHELGFDRHHWSQWFFSFLWDILSFFVS